MNWAAPRRERHRRCCTGTMTMAEPFPGLQCVVPCEGAVRDPEVFRTNPRPTGRFSGRHRVLLSRLGGSGRASREVVDEAVREMG